MDFSHSHTHTPPLRSLRNTGFASSHSHTSTSTSTPPTCALENTGYTYSLSSSYTSLPSKLQKEKRVAAAAAFDPPKMSRRSLRLHTTGGHYGDDSLLDSSLSHSVTYASSSASRRDSRTLKSRRQHQSLSSSQSLLHTPRKSQSGAALLAHTSLHSCAASDSSLLSTMLDESCIQERTLVDSFWGLDEETDLRDQSLRADRSVALVNGDTNSAQTQTSVLNGYICGDCSVHSERKDALTAYSSSRNNSSSSSSCAAVSRSAHTDSASAAAAASSTTIYSRDKSRKHKTGLLASATNRFLLYSRSALVCLVSVATLLARSIPIQRLKESRGVLASLSESCLCFSRRAASSIAAFATSLVRSVLLKMYLAGSDVSDRAHQRYCGSVNVNHLTAADGQLTLNGSLCDDCKGKQHQETLAVRARSSRAGRLMGALWGALAFAGASVLRAGPALGLAGWSAASSLLSVLQAAAASPGKAVTGAFWWLGTAWYQLVTLASLLNVFILTRVLPKLCKLLLFLLPLLLLLGVWFWCPASMLAYLPVVNLTAWSTASHLPWAGPTAPSAALEELTHPTTALPPTASQAGNAHFTAAPPQQVGVAVSVDAERLSRLEQSLARLWEAVRGGARLQEEQHGEVLGLYASLREQLDMQTDRESLGLWVSGLLDQRLGLLSSELEQGEEREEEAQQQYALQQQSHESRLAEMETLLQALTAKTEDLQQRPETATAAAPVSVGMDSETHSALLGQVQRLEAELARIRQDLQGVIGCQGRCDQLDSLHDTVSAQVKQELRALFYGSAQEGEEEEEELPAPLLPWLSAQFARGSDLRASLASLERSILGNLSLQLEQSRQPPDADAVAHTVASAVGAAGMSEEQVQLIVRNALELYSQDRTGLVDYALESGGGSVLSTRCSETFETKTALMSLFGLPLWYFSQSPRVVIQPDVHPGNCWAFKGSQGYLVIRLSMRVRPTAFSLEHIPKSLSPTGNISSAPREFTVYGLEDEAQEVGEVLGQYTYQEDGDSLQTFPITVQSVQPYQIIEMRVLSNWGHPEYTCLYRFRVHGEPAPLPEGRGQ
ncbi:SUN domain-containing protein 1-like isoform X1 [Anguilla anguilla]|uniref:SUN domain-containing protein 1-like isoform X1 n=2 Tax=Anguilla anguilla TaxID=7936 RepID=UPI0015AAC37A|nr:SUN domain-containing protein 1-like isoform X1 [Anguilla anguilla]XP_035260715.1 SUN domain-containing protein 1-like isoform X1 [Anguilla anguilla]